MYASGCALILCAVNDDDENLAKLDALVGAALKGLVEAGASAEAIGAFAATYRHEASQVLGITPRQPEVQDLQTLVTHAVTQVLSDIGITANLKKSKPRYKKFYITVDGVRTSVTVSPQTANDLIKAKGSKESARQFVEQIASSAPHEVQNRSGWTEERIIAALSFASDAADIAPNQARH